MLLQHSGMLMFCFHKQMDLGEIAKLCPLESSSTLSSAPLSLQFCCFQAALCLCGSGSDRILVRVYTQNLGLFLSLDHFFPICPLPRLHFSTLCSLVLRPEGLWIFFFLLEFQPPHTVLISACSQVKNCRNRQCTPCQYVLPRFDSLQSLSASVYSLVPSGCCFCILSRVYSYFLWDYRIWQVLICLQQKQNLLVIFFFFYSFIVFYFCSLLCKILGERDHLIQSHFATFAQKFSCVNVLSFLNLNFMICKMGEIVPLWSCKN